MKPAPLLLAGIVALLAGGDSPKPTAQTHTTAGSGTARFDGRSVDRTARNLVSTVHDLRATPSGTRSDLGDLWREANSLRRAGANARTIEYYGSDLEQSLRRGPQGAAATRHALNNLEHEATILRQRLRRQ